MPDVQVVRGKWYSKSTGRFLGNYVKGQTAPTGALKSAEQSKEDKAEAKKAAAAEKKAEKAAIAEAETAAE